MRYVCLIYHPVDGTVSTPAEVEHHVEEYGKLIAEATQAGTFLTGADLGVPTNASTLRIRNGKRVVTDGPYAEAKEVLGGFMVFDVANLDEALAYAARIPGAEKSSIEVRPVIEH